MLRDSLQLKKTTIPINKESKTPNHTSRCSRCHHRSHSTNIILHWSRPMLLHRNHHLLSRRQVATMTSANKLCTHTHTHTHTSESTAPTPRVSFCALGIFPAYQDRVPLRFQNLPHMLQQTKRLALFHHKKRNCNCSDHCNS